MGLRSDIVRIYLSEKSSIKYDSTVDRYLDGLSVLYIEYRISAVTIVSFEHKDKFSVVFNKSDFHSLFVRIVSKRKCVQRADTSFLTKFHDSKIDRYFFKYLIVVIQIPTLYLVVL